jgi:hypothetical protein
MAAPSARAGAEGRRYLIEVLRSQDKSLIFAVAGLGGVCGRIDPITYLLSAIQRDKALCTHMYAATSTRLISPFPDTCKTH